MTTENSAIVEAIESALQVLTEEAEQRKLARAGEYSARAEDAVGKLAQAADRLRAGRVTLFDPAQEIARRFPEMEADEDLPGAVAVDRLWQWLADLDPAELERQLPVPRENLIEQARNLFANPEEGIEIDDDAAFSVAHDAVWVQAWVRVPTPPEQRKAS